LLDVDTKETKTSWCGCLSKTSFNQAKACFGFTENQLQKSIAIKNMVIFWLSQEPVQLFLPS
jgi:hypothetical protein